MRLKMWLIRLKSDLLKSQKEVKDADLMKQMLIGIWKCDASKFSVIYYKWQFSESNV